jgi:uncharacterized protein YhfF
MAKNQDKIRKYWIDYLATIKNGGHTADLPEAWSFGDGKDMADELGNLVRSGIKTATCSLLWEYDYDGDALPESGELSIILDGNSEPLCLIETTEIQIRPYDQVDSQFAYEEGEGDRSLAYWRKAHWHFFTRVCERIGRDPDNSMPLVCERFRVIYPAAASSDDS